MSKIGDNIRVLRSKTDLTIRQLAEKVGISANTMAAYERNAVIPTVPNAFKISSFFNVPMEYLVNGDNADTAFTDMGLLKLAKEVDALEQEDKELAKAFLGKLIKNRGEREELKRHAGM